MDIIATAEATPNIAVIKYWGKRNEKLILPVAGSVSATLDEQLKTRTTVMFSDKFAEDEVWINNTKMTTPEQLEKALPQLDVIREIAGIKQKAKVVSYALTPLAGGLAGSASGLAALAVAGTKAAGLSLDSTQLSIVCRRGSGSACRSVVPGWGEWLQGSKEDGSDSHAAMVADDKHWPEMRVIIAMVSKKEKKVKSRAGMKQTVATSPLYKQRIQDLPQKINAMKKAILARDFPAFAELTMRDSNEMHATMLNTWPPIIYLNDVSRQVIDTIHDLNANEIKAAYTFDAGPNPCIYVLEKNVPEVLNILKGIEGIEETIVCKLGSGPKLITDANEHLINEDGSTREHSYDHSKQRFVIR